MKKGAYILFFAIVFLQACTKQNRFDCFKSNGAEVTQLRDVGVFDSLVVNDKFEVTISQGKERKIEITAGRNLLGNISTKVVNGQLIISNKNACNFVRGYKHKLKIHITVPYLKGLVNDGVGPVVFDDNFKQDVIRLRGGNSGDTYLNGTYTSIYSSSHGNGDMYFSGSTQAIFVYSNGTNSTYAQNLDIRGGYASMSLHSIGNAYFNLNNVGIFDCQIYKSGNIYYAGNPGVINLSSDSNGSGRVIKQD